MSDHRRPIVVHAIAAFFLAVLGCCIQIPAHAQSGPRTVLDIDWRERHAPNGELTAHDSMLLGDAVDLSSGRLSFEQVDVSLPGNSGLPVEIRRRLNPSQMQSGEFADWQLAIPTISTKILADEWYANPPRRWGKIRCSGALVSAIPDASWPTHFSNGYPLPPDKWNDGVILDVPGRVKTQVLDKTVSSAWPASASKVTTEGWYLECLSNIDGAGTQGFVAVAPNGDRYTFNVVMNPGSRKSEFDIWQLDSNFAGNNGIHWTEIGVHYDILAVSQVVDVHGNWVQFNYDANKRLQSITSNDGRRIDVGRTFAQIDSVTANPGTAAARQWTYAYGWKTVTSWQPPATVNGAGGGSQQEVWGTLTGVTLPNGRQWQFDLGNLQARAVPGTSYSTTVCQQFNQTVSLTHPDGVTGTFTIEERLLRLGAGATGSTGPYCPNSSLGSVGSSQLTNVMAVTSKSLSGPGMTSATWTYSYYDTGGETQVTIQQPDGSKRVVWHPVPYNWATGAAHTKLTKEELYATAASTTPVEVRNYGYIQESAAGSNFILNSVQDTYRPVRLSDTVITRGSDVYNTHTEYNIDRTSASYSHGFPTSVQQWSSLGGVTRQTDTVYAHNTSLWILGLPDTITRNGKLFDDFTYNSTGQVTQHERFGAIWRNYEYHTSVTAPDAPGMPRWVDDGLTRRTQFRSWKRGVPQQVERYDGSVLVRTVDDNGWVRDITDWKNNPATYFEYDGVGRLTAINNPGYWDDVILNYSYPNGGLVQLKAHGSLRTTTQFDGMLRPKQVFKEPQNYLGGNVYIEYQYDAMGRRTFEALPSNSAGSSIGIQTDYDSLGRVTRVAETAGGGGATNYEYLAGNKTLITDPMGNQTTKTASGWGDPNDGKTIIVQSPEGIRVDFNHDVYGNLLSIAQTKDNGSAHTSSFEYDTRLRMCRRKTPETGNTLYSYNDENELRFYAEGQADGTGCVAPPAASAVELTYDAVGRIKDTNYPGSTPDIARTYDANGNLLTINRGGVNWTYTYNEMDLVETEELKLDGRTYLIDPEYDASGAIVSRTFPSGHTYDYFNDDYGRTRDVYYNGTQYLWDATYHPNGKLHRLYRGTDGGHYLQLLNARQLVSYIGSSWGGGNFGQSADYFYDLAGRVQAIQSTSDEYDQSFGYDGAGRLKSANGVWGGGLYTYDRLGNLKHKVEGYRTVDIEYTDANRVDRVRDSAVSANWRTYVHDARGNVTNDGIHGFNYDYANQPTSVTGLDAGTFTYDGNLRRVKQVIDGRTIYSIYDRTGQLLTRDDATASTKTDYINVAGQTFARAVDNLVFYPQPDHLGSPQFVADEDGWIALFLRYNYTPWGESIGVDPGNNNLQGYTGHIEDETGLTYMQARYYDPVIGRFLSPDPIGYEDQLNLYAYVSNDPLNRIDPLGRQDKPLKEKDGKNVIGEHGLDSLGEYSIDKIDEMNKAADNVNNAVTPEAKDKAAPKLERATLRYLESLDQAPEEISNQPMSNEVDAVVEPEPEVDVYDPEGNRLDPGTEPMDGDTVVPRGAPRPTPPELPIPEKK